MNLGCQGPLEVQNEKKWAENGAKNRPGAGPSIGFCGIMAPGRPRARPESWNKDRGKLKQGQLERRKVEKGKFEPERRNEECFR